jgi:hypothetical protein
MNISKRVKRVLVYRILSVASEYLIVYVATGGSIIIPMVTTPICIVVHTGLHYAIERSIK